ncbi:hypothetical protein, partial [Arthrobacter sp. CAN_A2]|uniref:hypothetical protein n=1 Tax=Arthrobacter sp. CAN_A2 TaxID=2787718 RepID=UPI002FF2051D
NARQPANSTNQKTIGINKLGTLLSSQTTGTTGTKHDHNSHILAPEQIFKPTRTHSITANPPIPVIPGPVPVHVDWRWVLVLRLSADQITSSARI